MVWELRNSLPPQDAGVNLSSQIRNWLLMIQLIAVIFGTEGFRYSSDGLGFSVVQSAGSRVECPIRDEPNITSYGNWPAGIVQRPGAFYGGVFDGSSVWLPPFDAAEVVEIDTATGNMTSHRLWPSGFFKDLEAFYGGTFDGTFVWLAPSGADRVIRIDPRTGAMTGFKDWPPGFVKGTNAFVGAVFDGTAVWLIPSQADRLIRIDPLSGNMTGHKNWPVGYTHTGMGFYGGVFDGSGIWLVPGNADRVIRVDTATGNMTGYVDWPNGILRGAFAFVGGVFDGSSVWLVPYSADRVVRINASNGNMTGYKDWPVGFGKGFDAFCGGVFDGTSIWLVPYKADRLIRIDPLTGTMTGYGKWPLGFPKPTRTFVGAAFDGSAMWLVPGEADVVLKVSSNCTVDTRSVSQSITSSLAPSETPTMSENSISGTLTVSQTLPPSTTHAKRIDSPATTSLTLTASPLSVAQGSPSSTLPPRWMWRSHTKLLTFSRTKELAANDSQRLTHTLQRIQSVPKPASNPLASLFNSDTVGVVVRTTGGTSAVLSSFVASPSTASRALRVGTVARVIDCAFVESDTEPSYMDLPVQASMGKEKFRAFAGSTVASTGTLIVLPFLLLLLAALYGRRRRDCLWVRWLQENVVATFSFMALGYIGPNTSYAFILVVSHGGTVAEVVAVATSMMAVSLLTLVVTVVVLKKFHSWFLVAQEETPKVAASVESHRRPVQFKNRLSNSMLLETFGAVFDGTRSGAASVRAAYVEELVLSIVLQVLSGIRPQSGECGGVAVSMAAVAGLHAGYLAVVRPYVDQLELFFAILTALLLLLMSIVAAATVFLGSTAVLMTALGVLLLLQNAAFFAQLVVMGFAALMRNHRKRLEHQWASNPEPRLDNELEPCGRTAPGLPLETPMLLHVPDLSLLAAQQGSTILNPLTAGTKV